MSTLHHDDKIVYNNIYMMGFVSVKSMFLIIAILAVFAYWVLNFVIIYHLARFGVGVQPKRFAAIFLFGSIVLFLSNVTLFQDINTDLLKTSLKQFQSSVLNATYQK